MSLILVLLIVLLVVAVLPGYYGSRSWGWGPYYGWSPFGIIILLIILAFVFGWRL